jgi:hypothetical protein
MKLQELIQLSEEQLDEGMWRNLIAAATFMLGSSHLMADKDIDTSHATMPPAVKQALDAKKKQANARKFVNTAAERVTRKFKVDAKIAKAIAQSAVKHEYPDFPTAKDILGVIGTESSFNPKAVSGLKKDPAVGLMQIRPGVWGIDPKNLRTIDDQIKVGAEILRTYYKKLGSRAEALHAYNVGLTNHQTGKLQNPRYVPKVIDNANMFEALREAEHPLDVSIAKQMAIEYVQENRPKIWAEGNPYADDIHPEVEDPDEIEYHAHRVVIDPHVNKVYRKIGSNEFLIQVEFWFADPKDTDNGLDWTSWIYVDIDKNTAREVADIHKWIKQDFIGAMFDGDENDEINLAKRLGKWHQIE